MAHQLGYGFRHFQLLLGCWPRKFPDARLRFFDDAGHHAHCFGRILPRCSLRRQHYRVRAVKNRVGHVGGLRARRARVFRHRFEHLRGGNHRAPELACSRNNGFLHHRHTLWIHFHAQVAPRNHHAIGCPQNRIQILDGFRLLQLGDHRSVFARAADQLFRQQHVFWAPHEAYRHVIRAVLQREDQVGAVFRGQRRHAQLHSGQVDSLVFAKRAAVCHFANHLVAANLLNPQLDQSVRKQDAVPAVNFSGQRRKRGIYARRIAQHFCGGDYETLSGAQQHRTATRQRPRSDFRSLKVRQDRDRFFVLDGGRPQHRDAFGMLLMRAVREIQPRYVHSRVQQPVDHPRRTARRSDRAHNFGMTEAHAPFDGTDCRLLLLFTGSAGNSG